MTTTKNDNLMHYDHESRIVRLEVTIDNINQTLIRMDKRFDTIDSNLSDMRKEISGNFKWLLTAIFGVYGILAGVLLKGFGIFH